MIISEPMDFGSEYNFKKFCEKNNAISIDETLYKYKPENGEPCLYMKVVEINPFITDDDLIAALNFRW